MTAIDYDTLEYNKPEEEGREMNPITAMELIDAGYDFQKVGWNEGWFYKGSYYSHNLPTLKDFISTLLTSEREKERERLTLERMNLDAPFSNRAFNSGYNQAVDDLEKLKQH